MKTFSYAIISKENNKCSQVINTTVENWVLNNDRDFSVVIPTNPAVSLLDKFYHDGKWWERVWNRYETIVEKDEHGNVISETVVPMEEYGYNDVELVF